jgi:hypothetical protein
VAVIKSPAILYAKGLMMLAVGILASTLLLLRHPKAMTALLLAVAVWGFCRPYSSPSTSSTTTSTQAPDTPG